MDFGILTKHSLHSNQMFDLEFERSFLSPNVQTMSRMGKLRFCDLLSNLPLG
jgi:hypothetical protein